MNERNNIMNTKLLIMYARINELDKQIIELTDNGDKNLNQDYICELSEEINRLTNKIYNSQEVITSLAA